MIPRLPLRLRALLDLAPFECFDERFVYRDRLMTGAQDCFLNRGCVDALIDARFTPRATPRAGNSRQGNERTGRHCVARIADPE